MKGSRLNYYRFADNIDVDAFEDAIEFDKLAEDGDEDIGKCLFPENHTHGDQTGKFAINREKKVYHCFVCGGGNLLSLTMEVKELDEEAATEWLHQFADGDIRDTDEFVDDFMELLQRFKERRAAQMPHFNKHVLEQFDPGADELTDWCAERMISEEVRIEHQLAYHPHHRKAAPLKGGKKVGEDYYGPCIVFPHWWAGQLVGWQHRWLEWDHEHTRTPKWLGKYTNTSDFPKHTTLYNYDKVIRLDSLEPVGLTARPLCPPVIVCEGVPDVLFLESFGYLAVCPFGAGIKPEQTRLLKNLRPIIVSPDNDPASEKKFVAPIQEAIRDAIVLPALAGESEGIGDLAKDEPEEGGRSRGFTSHLLQAYLAVAPDYDPLGLTD